MFHYRQPNDQKYTTKEKRKNKRKKSSLLTFKNRFIKLNIKGISRILKNLQKLKCNNNNKHSFVHFFFTLFSSFSVSSWKRVIFFLKKKRRRKQKMERYAYRVCIFLGLNFLMSQCLAFPNYAKFVCVHY